MKLEVEQKFRVHDADTVRRRLTEFGATFEPSFPQVDAYYNHPARDFAATDEALRIRTVGERNFVTYKGPKQPGDLKIRRELEQPLVDGSTSARDFETLLEALSFRPSAKVEKRRTPGSLDWQGTRFEIAWDEVEGLGTFVELELVVEEGEFDVARWKLLALQQSLQLGEVERRSYLEMILELNGPGHGTLSTSRG